MNSRIRHEISLEFIHVNIESTVEAKRCCDTGHHLRYQSVQVDVARAFDVESVK